VYIDYKDRRLLAASLSLSEAGREFGLPIGRKYIQRLAVLRATDRFAELFGHRALRFHALHGDRDGQFAMTLTANFRLIVERVAEDRVRILDVEDYHGS
jgi:proteic killer suppression protein